MSPAWVVVLWVDAAVVLAGVVVVVAADDDVLLFELTRTASGLRILS